MAYLVGMSDKSQGSEVEGNPFACPECGNADRRQIEDNGRPGLALTLRCRTCPDGEWTPGEMLTAYEDDWEYCDDRDAIRLWQKGWDWPAIRVMVEAQREGAGR